MIRNSQGGGHKTRTAKHHERQRGENFNDEIIKNVKCYKEVEMEEGKMRILDIVIRRLSLFN